MTGVDYKSAFRAAVDQVRGEGRYRVFADLKRRQGAFPHATWRTPGGQDRDVVVWCSNDYLGQGQNPVVIEAMHLALDEAGSGSGGTRNISGTTRYHVELEKALADLPGKGSAAVSRSDKMRWQQVMVNYLVSRPGLTGIVLLCDPRLGLTELDEALLEVVRPRVEEGLKFLIVLTKADKLTRAEQAKVLSITRLNAGGGEVKMFSALKKQGVDEVAQLLWQWAHPVQPAAPAAAPDGTAAPEAPEDSQQN